PTPQKVGRYHTKKLGFSTVSKSRVLVQLLRNLFEGEAGENSVPGRKGFLRARPKCLDAVAVDQVDAPLLRRQRGPVGQNPFKKGDVIDRTADRILGLAPLFRQFIGRCRLAVSVGVVERFCEERSFFRIVSVEIESSDKKGRKRLFFLL